MLLAWRETDALEVADVPMATFSLVNISKKECTRTFPVTGNIWCFANSLTLSLSLQSLSVKLVGCAWGLSMAFENCGKSQGSRYLRMHCNWNSHNVVASICLSSLIGCGNELARLVILGVIINVVQWIIGCRRCKDIWAKIPRYNATNIWFQAVMFCTVDQEIVLSTDWQFPKQCYSTFMYCLGSCEQILSQWVYCF